MIVVVRSPVALLAVLQTDDTTLEQAKKNVAMCLNAFHEQDGS